ncbi:MAG: GDSL-type esterase/lipase family protein [Oscillospiraceae bacterium]|nr:GDSL-type esterase/lipase family protein [Oscillospiraceae bacterium]
MFSKPETMRAYACLSHIAKICAAIAVFAFFLAMRAQAPGEPEKSAGAAENGQSQPLSPAVSEKAEISAVPLNGRYKQIYYNGDIYVGDFVDSIRSGHGTYTWANGIVYTGKFADGEPTGEGTYVYPTEAAADPPRSEEPPEPTDPPPTATSPPVPPEETSASPPVHLAEIPKSGFIQMMFEQAVEIPGTGKRIEPPPAGRNIETQFGAVPLSSDIPEPYGYFKNFIFLGDSVTMGFDVYRGKITFGGEAVLRDASVVAVGSYSINNALRDVSANSVHPLQNGAQARPEDIIAAKDAKYVLICLGLNDLGLMPVEDYVQNYSALVARIKEKSPGKTVVIMSVTPLVYAAQKTRLNNDAISRANNALLIFARENSIPFIDYGAAIRDSQNNLYDEFSSDAYCHLTISAYNRIVEYLLYHPLP